VAKPDPWAKAVCRLVCWQKFSFDDAYNFLQIEGLFEGPHERYLEKIAQIRKAPCRENPVFQSLNEVDSNAQQNMNSSSSNPLEFLIVSFTIKDASKRSGLFARQPPICPKKISYW
jgi:hypothetical protein